MKRIISRLFREREDVENFSAVSLALAALLMVGIWFYPGLEILLAPPEQASAATTSVVTVSASVAATISCATDQSSTAFGVLTDAVITTSTPNASTTISCSNSGNGCSLYVKDVGNAVNGGLATTSPAYLIPSPNAAFAASATLVAGTEGYGLQAATTTIGNGAILRVASRYFQTGNTVGGLTISNLTVASTTASSSLREIVSTHKAAISTVTQAASYVDTITYECTAN